MNVDALFIRHLRRALGAQSSEKLAAKLLLTFSIHRAINLLSFCPFNTSLHSNSFPSVERFKAPHHRVSMELNLDALSAASHVTRLWRWNVLQQKPPLEIKVFLQQIRCAASENPAV